MNAPDPQKAPSTAAEWVQVIDHTLLRPDATAKDIRNVVLEAWDWGFWSICIYPSWLSHVRGILTELWDSDLESTRPKYQQAGKIHLPHLCSVVGFPTGAQTTRAKVTETLDAIRAGAQEIDWVLPIGCYLSGDGIFQSKVKKELQEITEAARFEGALSKVILETSYLSPDQIRELTLWSAEVGADFVKTSTGFGSRGASLEDIKVMVDALKGSATKIKASGGIRDFKTAQSLVQAGAHRIGSSASVRIMQEMQLFTDQKKSDKT
jgi:deoxyribose-phosphate aldolase